MRLIFWRAGSVCPSERDLVHELQQWTARIASEDWAWALVHELQQDAAPYSGLSPNVLDDSWCT